jgi:hypothetical protein
MGADGSPGGTDRPTEGGDGTQGTARPDSPKQPLRNLDVVGSPRITEKDKEHAERLPHRAEHELRKSGWTGNTAELLKVGEEMGKAADRLGRNPKSTEQAAALRWDGAQVYMAAALQDLRMAQDPLMADGPRSERQKAAVSAAMAALGPLRLDAEDAWRRGDEEEMVFDILKQPGAEAYLKDKPDSIAARVVRARRERLEAEQEDPPERIFRFPNPAGFEGIQRFAVVGDCCGL